MQAPVHPLWHDDAYWVLKDAASLRAASLRSQAIDAFWARFAGALRPWRRPQRSTPPGRVPLCD